MTRKHRRRLRAGLVLIIVTVLLLLISLGALGLISLVQTEYRASRLRGDEVQLENVAAAGRDYLAALARRSRADQAAWGGLAGNQGLFLQQTLAVSGDTISPIHFSIVPLGGGSESESQAWGPLNESSKLHLQQVLQWDQANPGTGFQALMALPGMTAEVADGILDWLDADAVPRSNGAEADRYASWGLGYTPRNAVPPMLDELLLVPGVTPELLFGEGEAATAQSRSQGDAPVRARRREPGSRFKAARTAHRPWRDFLTVVSRERNENYRGQSRIFLNSTDLVGLHQLLSVRLGVNWANFVVAFRQFGPARGRRGTVLDAYQPDLNVPPQFEFQSEVDLVGTRVPVHRESRAIKVIESPLSPERVGWTAELSRVLDEVTVDPQPIVAGRVNIDLAPRDVLLAIPGFDVVMVDQILAARPLISVGGLVHTHPAWLLEQGVVELKAFAALLPRITTGGDVWSAEIRVERDDSPLRVRDEFMTDGTAAHSVHVYCKDLRDQPVADGQEVR